MTSPQGDTTVGVLASGGLDSAILLAHMAGAGQRVQPFYIRSQLAWERVELPCLRRFMAAIARPELAALVVLDLPLADVYGDHWSVSGRSVPDSSTPDEAVYLPGRNALLAIKAALWCGLNGVDRLQLAALGTSPFPDATIGFFDDLSRVLNRATGGQLTIEMPFAGLNKRQVMELGRDLPLELTFSCIAPMGDLHCGRCNKCAERKGAFALIQMPDPTHYAAPMP
jgi:7-cyano-7-deazaguanine synthase